MEKRDELLREEMERGEVKYFVKEKIVHKYPVPESCSEIYGGEPLFDSPPVFGKKCKDCWRFHAF